MVEQRGVFIKATAKYKLFQFSSTQPRFQEPRKYHRENYSAKSNLRYIILKRNHKCQVVLDIACVKDHIALTAKRTGLIAFEYAE